MADALEGRSGIDAIHILSHGSQGSVQLGATSISSANLVSYNSQLATIGSSLSASGDILLYGCNVAQGQAGVDFIGKLAQATGADIAASNNLTGAADKGGDWVLETLTGQIDYVLIAAGYQGVLGGGPGGGPPPGYVTFDLNAINVLNGTITQVVGSDTLSITAKDDGYQLGIETPGDQEIILADEATPYTITMDGGKVFSVNQITGRAGFTGDKLHFWSNLRAESSAYEWTAPGDYNSGISLASENGFAGITTLYIKSVDPSYVALDDFNLFDIQAASVADPTLTNLDNTAYVLSSAATLLDSELEIADPVFDPLNFTSGNYQGMKLILERQGGANTDDEFGIQDEAGTSGTLYVWQDEDQVEGATFSYSSGALTINVTGPATKSDVLGFLQKVTYSNSSANAGDAVLEWTLYHDNTSAGTAYQQTVSLSVDNESPVIATGDYSATNWGFGNDISVSGIFTSSNTMGQSGAAFSGEYGLSNANGQTTYTITLSQARASASLTMFNDPTGNAGVVYQNVPGTIEFLDASNNVLNTATIAGTPANGVNYSYAAGSPTIKAIRVTNTSGDSSKYLVVDAMTLDGVNTPLTLSAITANLADGSNAGMTVADLIPDGLISDPDTGTPPDAIAVSAVDNAHGAWQYKIGSGAWTAFDFSGGNSGKYLLLDSTDSVRFVPAADWTGTVNDGITFGAWDKASGTAGSYYSLPAISMYNEPISHTSTVTASITVDASAANEAPVFANTITNSFTANGSSAAIGASLITGVSTCTGPDGAQYILYADADVDGNSDPMDNGKLSVSKLVNGNWVQVGSANFSSDTLSNGYTNTAMAIAPDGTPYVLYNDHVANKAKVMALVNGSWTNVGEAISTYLAELSVDLQFANDGTLYAAFAENPGNTNNLKVMKLNGTSWEQVGSNVSANNAYNYGFALSPAGTPYIIDYEYAAGDAIVKKFDGTDWVAVGSSLGSISDTSIAFKADGTPVIAYNDANGVFRLKTFDGADWNAIANTADTIPDWRNNYVGVDESDNIYVLTGNMAFEELTLNYYYNGTWHSLGSTPLATSVNLMDSRPSLNVSPDGIVSVAWISGGSFAPPQSVYGITGAISNSVALTAQEGQTSVSGLTVTDPENQDVTLTIVGGADQAKFQIVGNQLQFVSSPSFASPTDIGSNNVYQVLLNASDAQNNTQVLAKVHVLQASNNAPTISGVPDTAQEVSTGVAAALDNFTVADADNDNLTVTLTATNGTINNLTDADANTAGIQLTGTAATINTALADATFTATNAGAASIGISVSDGTAAPVTAAYNLTATASAANEAPVISHLTDDIVYTTTGTAILIDAVPGMNDSATIADDNANFSQGYLFIDKTSGPDAVGDFSSETMNLKFGATEGDADGTPAAGDKVFVFTVDGWVEIGAVDTLSNYSNGQGGRNLLIDLNASATPGYTSLILQNLKFSSDTTGSYQFRASVSDGNSLDSNSRLSNLANFTVNVSTPLAAPIIADLDGDTMTATPNTAVYIDERTVGQLVSVTDSDSSDFTGGSVTISLDSGTADGSFVAAQSDDMIAFFTLGTDTFVADPFSLTTYHSTPVAGDYIFVKVGGTWTSIGRVDAVNDGQGGHDLTIGNLAGGSTPANVATFLQYLQYSAPTTGTRAFNVQITDDSSTQSNVAQFSVDVSAPTNAFANLNGDSNNWAGIGLATKIDNNNALATVSHADTSLTHWNGATLTVERTTADQNKTGDIYDFNTSGALFTVSGSYLQSGGQTFGTFTSANGVLTISFANDGADASNALVDDVLQHITYRNDTPYGDTTLRFTITDAAGSATADATMVSASIFIDNATDTATIDRSNGVSFSEAIAIAASDATNGANRLYLAAGMSGQTVSMSAATSLGESVSVDFDKADTAILAGGTLSVDSGKTLSFGSGTNDTLDVQGVLAGAGNLALNAGGGTVTLSGNNTYSGTTTLYRGTLAVSDQANLGTSSTITIYPATSTSEVALRLAGSSGTITSNIVTTPRSGNSGDIEVTSGTYSLTGALSGTGDLNVWGNGTLVLSNANTDTHSGSTNVEFGTTLQVDRAMSNTGNVAIYGTLQGTGSIGTIATNGGVAIFNNGVIAAAGNGVGTITLNNDLAMLAGATLKADVTGTTAGTGYDQIVVKGAVVVDGAILDLNLGSFVPSTNDSFVLIDNDGADAITGQIMVGGMSLAQGDTFTTGGKTYEVSYTAGTGNDLGLTVIVPANALKQLNADSVVWAGVGNTVLLDASANATASHADSSATNWNGATLTVQRSGTAVTTDTIDIDATGASFTASGGNLQSGGQTFGTYTSANGVLTINFANSGTDAADALVNDVLRHIAYRNDTPASNATLQFSLTPAAASAVTADVTVTSDKIYVTTGTDTAADNLNDGVAFSEALRIANNQAGSDTLVLKSTLANQTVSAANVASLDGDVIVDCDAASGATISNGSLNTNGNTLTFTNGSGDTLSVSTNLTGTGNLAKTGAGTATLSGTNTYSGATSITGGKIVANGSDSLGTSAVTLDAGTLGFGATNNWTIANAITLGAGGGTIASSSGSNGGTTTVSGVISGGNLTLTSGNMNTGNPQNGVVYLTGTNTYTGTTTLALNSGTGIAQINGDANLGGGNIIFTSGRLSIAGNTVIDNAIQATGANASFIVASGTTTEITGVISGSNGIVSGGSGGTLKLSGTNTYSGSTYGSSGNTIIASTDASLPDGTQLELGAGSLTLLSNQTVGSLNPSASVDSASVINLGTYDFTLGSGSASNFAGVINGTGNLVKNGSGTFTISSTYATATGGDYSGTTTVNAGALQLDGTLKGNIVVATGGKLSGGGADSTEGEALGTVTVESGGTLSIGGSGGTNTTADLKTGNLTVASGGTLAMSLGGTTAGATSSGYDQAVVTGTVDVNDATLNVTLVSPFVPVAGDVFTIVANDSDDAVTGIFNGLAEGATVTANGTQFKLSYAGGDGNDITLTVQMVFSSLDISDDTGDNTDFITGAAAQTITAALSANLATDMTVWGSVDNGGTWIDITSKVSGQTLTWDTATLSGSSTIKIKALNASNVNVGEVSQAYTLDTTGPVGYVDTYDISADTGDNTDFITKTASQTISGTLSAPTDTGEKVQVSVDAGSTWIDATNVIGQTTWSKSGVTLLDGVNPNGLQFRVVDVAGNTSAPAVQDYTLDTTVPTITISAIGISADSGISSADFITKTAAQTITATLSGAPAGTDIVYGSLDNGSTWTDITNKVSGTALTWNGVTLTASSTIKLKVTDEAGNDGTVSSQAYTFDTAAPTASVTTANVGIGTNVSTGQSTETGAIYLVKTGTAVSDQASLETAVTGSNATKATVTASGTNTPIATTGLTAGTYKVYSVDAAGNVSAASANTITLGTAPTTTVATAVFSADSGTSSSDFITKTAAQDISGTLSAVTVAGETVEVSLDNGSTWVSATNVVGESSWTLAGQTLAGSNTLQARVTSAGFSSAPYSHAYTLDTVAPTASVSTATIATGSNVTTSQSTETGTVYLVKTGTAVSDLASLETAVTGTNATKATVTATGTNTPIATTGLAAGTYKVYSVDAAGNVSAASANTITLATPPTTTNLSAAFSADTGVSNTDFITSTAAQNLSGTLSAVTVAGETVEVSLNNGTTWTTATNVIGETGWTLAGQTLTASNTMQVRVTNAGISGTATTQAYVLDTTAPTSSVTTATVGIGSNVTTSQSTETGIVYLVKTTDTPANYAALEALVTGGTATKATVTASSTNTPIGTTGLAAGTYKIYSVDAAGNISSVSANTITLVVNSAPTLGSVPGTTQEVTTGAVAALPDFTVNDADGGNLTVTLTATNGSISGVADADAGTAGIQITGTPAQINTALAAATFTATAAGAATVGLSVSDGIAVPVTATYNLNATTPSSEGGGTTPPSTTTGTISGGTTTTTTSGDGGTTTTITGTLGTVPVVETVVTAPDGTVTRELVFTPTSTGGTGAPVQLPLLYESTTGSGSNTTATLPSGIGLSSVGERTPQPGSSNADLINLIQTTVDQTDPTKSGMLSGGQSFLDQRPADATLWINKIVLTAPDSSSPPATPVIITGASNLPTGQKLEALVIDASSLPSGTTLELQNVDFAVVQGDGVLVRGGSGSNIVYGSAGSQDIFLGADDDLLYGGAGNDKVGSAAGNDRIFGNSGNDQVYGGEGNDLLHGGSGTDVVTYSGSISRYQITRDHGKTFVRSLDRGDDIDTLINCETISFDDGSYTVQNDTSLVQIASLYKQVLGRQAEIGGFQYWAETYDAGHSMGEIAMHFLYSAEYTNNRGQSFETLTQSDQISLLTSVRNNFRIVSAA